MRIRRIWPVAILLGILLFGLVIFAPAAEAANSGPVGYVATGALHVRSGPGVDYGVVTIVYQNQPLTLLARHDASTWVQVRTPSGHIGWVNSYYLTMTVALYTLPEAGTAPAPSPGAGPTAVVATGALNVRHGPGVGYGVATVVYRGQSLAVLGRDNAANWLRVRVPAVTEGWVGAYLVNLNVPVSTLPVIGSAPSAPTGVVTRGALNVRAGPGMGYQVIANMYQRQAVTLLGRTYDAGWVKVRLPGGTEGWIATHLLTLNVGASTLPVLAGAPPAAGAVVTTGALHVRYGPGVVYYPLAIVYWGDNVTLLGRDSTASWAQVRLADGRVGWVSSYYLNPTVSLYTLPVVW